MKRINKLDLFPKFDQQFENDARQKTATGGVFSVATVVIISILIISEVKFFFTVVEQHEMIVDPDVGGDMHITLDVTLFRIPCDILTIASVDSFGGVSLESAHSLKKESKKRELDAEDQMPEETTGVPIDYNATCPSCYGAGDPGACCHTCDDVRRAYEKRGWMFDVRNPSFIQCGSDLIKMKHVDGLKESCRIHGSLTVPRVTGSIHILPGRFFHANGQQIFDPMHSFTAHLNLSHAFTELNFGTYFPGQLNPLDGSEHVRGGVGRRSGKKKQANGRYSYFLQVIPTRYESRSLLFGAHSALESNQYSATQHFVPSTMDSEHPEENASTSNQPKLHPGIVISYDLAPIKVHIRRQHPYPSITHLFLQLCAVCGGVLTVAGLLDSIMFHGVRKVKNMRKVI